MSGTNGEKTGIPVLRSESTSLDAVRLKGLAAAPPPPPAEQSDWQRYFNSVMRHKWLVLTVTLLGTLAGVIATRFLDPRYTAKAI
ncbi:MAG TPA: Wzz/FepE/Etk N-terminal domain-containing protein, partial [Gemmatimonadales bacterium]|nr:Wzz/FepE/Etk N-terminal domain-containing protein [Gemmatimonadales bacterium]